MSGRRSDAGGNGHAQGHGHGAGSDAGEGGARPGPGEGGWSVAITDLSGGNPEGEPVETVTGFVSAEHADAFARRYVRASVERCRERGMDAEAVLEAWRAFGEDAHVTGPRGPGDTPPWSSEDEAPAFAAMPVREEEERDWRALDPRTGADFTTDGEGGDGEAGTGEGDGDGRGP